MNLAHISSCLIFIITITTLTGEKLNTLCNLWDKCLPSYVIPVHYHIELKHMFRQERFDCSVWCDLYRSQLSDLKNEYDSFHFRGESNITINILQSTQYIKMHTQNLFIIPWKITIIKNNGIIYELEENLLTSETYVLKSQFPVVLSPGLYTLKLKFVGYLTEDWAKNFFRSFYTNKENGFFLKYYIYDILKFYILYPIYTSNIIKIIY